MDAGSLRACADLASLLNNAEMESLAARAAGLVAPWLRDAIAARGVAHLVLTGGREGTALTEAIAEQDLPWHQIHLWWGDERLVPQGDPDRNEGQVAIALRLMDGAQIHRMPTSAAADATREYAAELQQVIGSEPFDVMLLGVGPDGHVASLFPGLFDPEDEALVREVIDSPKPPPRRLTMTLARLNNSRHVLIIASGEAKRSAIEAARTKDHSVPVGWIAGIESTTIVTDLSDAAGS